MNRCFPLLLSLFLLCGCAAQNPLPATADSPVTADVLEVPVIGFYDAGNILETQTQGALQVYPLQGKEVIGFLSIENSLLLFARTATGTELMLLTGDELYPATSLYLDFIAKPEETSIYPELQKLSLWNPNARQIVILDFSLQNQSVLDTPAEMIGTPVLSLTQNTLYYCTTAAVRALDLTTGISRILKEIRNPYQQAVTLLLADSILHIQTTNSSSQEQHLFLSTQSGQLLHQSDRQWMISSWGSAFYAKHETSLLNGEWNGEVHVLHPAASSYAGYFLPEGHQAVTISHANHSQTLLDCYDLDSGKRTASVTIDAILSPSCVEATDDSIWLLEGSVLYRWNPALSPTADATVYTNLYSTQQNPDVEGLSDCIQYAQSIGESYGIEVLVYKDAVALQTKDYSLQYAHSVPILQRELSVLKEQLAMYPDTLWHVLSRTFSGITICLVDSITGTPASGFTDSIDSLLIWDNYHAYIILATEKAFSQPLHRQLYHLIDTVVLTESIAYDQWHKLNPSDFQYSHGVSQNQTFWLQADKASFIDSNAMQSPKDDRAKIMEYAMTPGHEPLFQSQYLQAKLRQICIGIREAFQLKDMQETFPWEQYLDSSLY